MPVTHGLSTKYLTARLQSLGSPNLLWAYVLTMLIASVFISPSGMEVGSSPAVISVGMMPGARALMRMLDGAYSMAAERVRPTRACFVAAIGSQWVGLPWIGTEDTGLPGLECRDEEDVQ